MSLPEVQSVLSNSLPEDGEGNSTATPSPNRCWNAMKFFSLSYASLPCIIAIAAVCVHIDMAHIQHRRVVHLLQYLRYI